MSVFNHLSQNNMLKQITTALLMTTAIMFGSVTFAADAPVTSTTAAANPEVQKLEQQLNDAETQLGLYKTQYGKATKTLSLLQKDETALKKEITSLESKIKALNTKISGLREQIKGKMNKCTLGQYWTDFRGGKCLSCPKNATCNGKTATCATGYTQEKSSQTGTVICTKKCEQGSHESAAWIKNHYKNCTKCRVVKIDAGSCAKNKNAHVHYYCDCDC